MDLISCKRGQATRRTAFVVSVIMMLLASAIMAASSWLGLA